MKRLIKENVTNYKGWAGNYVSDAYQRTPNYNNTSDILDEQTKNIDNTKIINEVDKLRIFSNNILELFKQYGLKSEKQISKFRQDTGIQLRYTDINNLLNIRSNYSIPYNSIKPICDALGVTEEWLFTEH